MNRSRALSMMTLAGLCAMQTACGTIKSKIFDSDNYTSEKRQVKCLQGIPETVDVPTHIKITVLENRYFSGPSVKSDGTGTAIAISARDGSIPNIPLDPNSLLKTITDLSTELAKNNAKLMMTQEDVDALNKKNKELNDKIAGLKKDLETATKEQTKYKTAANVQPTRSMAYEVINKKELFTVDFKRPASGVGDIKLHYGKASGGQFFDSVKQDVSDTTIADVGGLVSSIANVLPKLKAIAAADAEADAKRAKLGLHAVSTVVAIEYFDIHQPNLEGHIQEFLDRNINACSPACNASLRPSPNATFPPQNPAGTAPNQSPPTTLPVGFGGTVMK